MATKTFTQSVTVSGASNSYAWSAPSNWLGGVLPTPGERVLIGASPTPGTVSFDDLNLGGRLQALQVLANSPLLDIAPGVSLSLNGPLMNAGSIEVESGSQLLARRMPENNAIGLAGTLETPDFLNQGTLALQGNNADIFLNTPQPVWHQISSNTVQNFDVGDALFLRGFVYTQSYPDYDALLSGTTLSVEGISKTGSHVLLYETTNFNTAADVTSFDANVVQQTNPINGLFQNFLELTAVCFVAGTRIGTEHGDVVVEDLKVNDRIVTVAGGERGLRPISWIGHRRIDLTTHPRPDSLFPIRIHRAALAANVPQRDLLVSPDHCLFIDGQLVPAKLLVNGMSIVQDRSFSTVHYYHVELATHDALLAEAVPAETYLDTGNRGFFGNGDQPVSLHPSLDLDADRLHWQDRLCAPLRLRSIEIEPIWARLTARAEQLGYERPTVPTTTEPDLRLIAGEREFRPLVMQGNRYAFVLPSDVSEVRIVSRAGVPVDVSRQADDWRRLGVAIRKISIRTASDHIEFAADHPAFDHGWHPVEQASGSLWRWTDGNAVFKLPPLHGVMTIELTLDSAMTYRLETHAPAERAAA